MTTQTMLTILNHIAEVIGWGVMGIVAFITVLVFVGGVLGHDT